MSTESETRYVQETVCADLVRIAEKGILVTEETHKDLIRDVWLFAQTCKNTESAVNLAHSLYGVQKDYGAVIHFGASVTVAMANAWMRENGFSGFQGSAMSNVVMRELNRAEWGDQPVMLRPMFQLLYPQMDYQMTRFPYQVRTALQAEARKSLRESPEMHPEVLLRHAEILADIWPFGIEFEPEEPAAEIDPGSIDLREAIQSLMPDDDE